ncbi:MAG: putative transposase [Ulvibacter sp.]|jgi:putative transposase
MTENGDLLENALAERINGILKGEYGDQFNVVNVTNAKKLLKAKIDLYNNERPHLSISNRTPSFVHQSDGKLKLNRLWKNYYKKKSEFGNQTQVSLNAVKH